MSEYLKNSNVGSKGLSWAEKISNPAQVGGIETAVLDNGPGRGARIAWVNTGSGLRYKVVLSRAMDIADAFYQQHSLSWLSHGGIQLPQPFSDRGAGWLRGFGGGLLVTCGLTHIGPPESDDFGERGLHGQISHVPAEIESIVQPDPASGQLEMSISGKMKQSQVLGPQLEFRRSISSILGEASITIKDEVRNCGNLPVPLMLLYHCNFGWPLVDEGTAILWKGPWQAREEAAKRRIFTEGNDFRHCAPPLDAHAGTGEEACFIDAAPDLSGYCHCGLHNPGLELMFSLRFKKEELPWLTNWQHWGRKDM